MRDESYWPDGGMLPGAVVLGAKVRGLVDVEGDPEFGMGARLGAGDKLGLTTVPGTVESVGAPGAVMIGPATPSDP